MKGPSGCIIAVALLASLLGPIESAPVSPDLSVSTNTSSLLLQHASVENADFGAVVADNGFASEHRRRNNLEVGQCATPDERIYTDNTIVENGGPSTLNGTLEIYIDAPIRITCIRIEDQITDGTGAIPSIRSGGVGESWVFVGVEAKYGQGFNFNIHIYGVPDDRNAPLETQTDNA